MGSEVGKKITNTRATKAWKAPLVKTKILRRRVRSEM